MDELKNLREMVNGLKNALFVAYNAIPEESVDIGISSEDALKKSSAIVANAQAKMISYECLMAAVKTVCDEKTSRKISAKTLELIDAYEKWEKSGGGGGGGGRLNG